MSYSLPGGHTHTRAQGHTHEHTSISCTLISLQLHYSSLCRVWVDRRRWLQSHAVLEIGRIQQWTPAVQVRRFCYPSGLGMLPPYYSVWSNIDYWIGLQWVFTFSARLSVYGLLSLCTEVLASDLHLQQRIERVSSTMLLHMSMCYLNAGHDAGHVECRSLSLYLPVRVRLSVSLYTPCTPLQLPRDGFLLSFFRCYSGVQHLLTWTLMARMRHIFRLEHLQPRKNFWNGCWRRQAITAWTGFTSKISACLQYPDVLLYTQICNVHFWVLASLSLGDGELTGCGCFQEQCQHYS